MSEHLPLKHNEKKIKSLAIAVVVISGLCAGILVWQYFQEQAAFGRYIDDIHMRYTSILDKDFIPTTRNMYLTLYSILDKSILNPSDAINLATVNKQYVQNTTNAWHGVPATLEQQKRGIIKSWIKKFNSDHPNYNGSLLYTMVVTPDCNMYVEEPTSTQMRLTRLNFRDHPWCFELQHYGTISLAVEPYHSNSVQQKVSTMLFSCCSLLNGKVTSYVGASLGLYNITNQLLFKKYNLDQTQTKFMMFVTYQNGTKKLFEPMNTTKYNNFLNRADDTDLRNSLDNLVHDNSNMNHLLKVHLRAGNYVIYWTDFSTTADNVARGYKWYGILMSKDAATSYDYYNNGFSILIILIILSFAGGVCAFFIFWFYRKMISDEDLLVRVAGGK